MTSTTQLQLSVARCAGLVVVDGFTVSSDHVVTTPVTTAQQATYLRRR
jgi:hypothetical protein